MLSPKFALTATGTLAVVIVGSALTSESAPAAPAGTQTCRYEVTVTNATRGQIFSPVIVASHDPSYRLFEIGEPASNALALMAEEGDNSMLATEFSLDSAVLDHRAAMGPLMPGASVTVTVIADETHDQISLGSMLVTTNDAFLALRNITLPAQSGTFFARAYDAGTEANSEDCMYIPGPPCGSAGAHDPSPAEGYVFVHAGVHGIGSLLSADHDWRDVVAEVSVQKVQ